MTYKTIAVYLPGPDQAADATNFAVSLSTSFDAHLTGFHVHSELPVAGTIGVQVPAEIVEQYLEALRKDAKAAQKTFTKAAEKSGVQWQWLGEEDASPGINVLSTISALARCVDLLVVAQPEAERRSGELIADIVLSAGRPTLMLPTGAKPLDLKGKVVVGWDGSREAARATFDALPILKHAGKVLVVTVGKGDDIKQAVANGGVTLAENLARHGVKAEVVMIAKGDASAGEALTGYVAEQDASLLVMGCYSHSRLRERLFGGATIHVLKNMAVPVLMSH